jgi:hypothetical protein
MFYTNHILGSWLPKMQDEKKDEFGNAPSGNKSKKELRKYIQERVAEQQQQRQKAEA